MPAPINPQKKTRRRFPRKVGNKTLDQILARREELLKELNEIDTELSKANLALTKSSASRFTGKAAAPEQNGMSNSSVSTQGLQRTQPQQSWSPAVPQDYTHDTVGSTMVSPLAPEEQVVQLHNNINSQVDQLRHRQTFTPATPSVYTAQPGEDFPF